MQNKKGDEIWTNAGIIDGGYFYLDQKIYHRTKHRIKIHRHDEKKKKEYLQQLALKLYQNLMISRVEPYEVSIRVTFLQDIKECMD